MNEEENRRQIVGKSLSRVLTGMDLKQYLAWTFPQIHCGTFERAKVLNHLLSFNYEFKNFDELYDPILDFLSGDEMGYEKALKEPLEERARIQKFWADNALTAGFA